MTVMMWILAIVVYGIGSGVTRAIATRRFGSGDPFVVALVVGWPLMIAVMPVLLIGRMTTRLTNRLIDRQVRRAAQLDVPQATVIHGKVIKVIRPQRPARDDDRDP